MCLGSLTMTSCKTIAEHEARSHSCIVKVICNGIETEENTCSRSRVDSLSKPKGVRLQLWLHVYFTLLSFRR